MSYLRRIYRLNLRYARRQLRFARRISGGDPGGEFTRSSYLEIYTVLRYVYLLLPIIYLPFTVWDVAIFATTPGMSPVMVIFDAVFYALILLLNALYQPGYSRQRRSLRRLKTICRVGVSLLAVLGTSVTLILLRNAEDLSLFSGTLLGIAVIFRFPDRTRFYIYGASYAVLYGAYWLNDVNDPVLIQNPLFILVLILIFDRLTHVIHLMNFSRQRRIFELNQLIIQEDIDKGDMLSIAVHDLKSPISGIMGVVRLMRDNPGGLPEYEREEILVDIEESTGKILAKIDDLVHIAGSPIGEMRFHYEVFDANRLVHATLRNYQHLASLKDVQIYTRFERERQQVYSDRTALTRILDNLVSNAVKYSPHGGSVFVFSQRVGDPGRLVDIRIQDEGAGFTEEDRHRAFGRFVRLSARPTGGESSTGLGLFTVHRLVQALDRTDIGLESQPNHGTSFIVTLPRAPLNDGLARRRRMRKQRPDRAGSFVPPI